MLKPKNIQIIGLVVFIFVVSMWFLTTNVSRNERQAAETEMSKMMAKNNREISSLRNIIHSMESEASSKKIANDGLMKSFKEKESLYSKQVSELQQELAQSRDTNSKNHQDMDKLEKKLKEMKEIETKVSNDKVAKPFDGKKLVHFDLKGAPPTREYLIELMKDMKELGADGFLFEYEDMFPWSGEFELLRAPHAYTTENIKTMLKTAEDEGLIVIPLVQTFGHLEFLLKHKQFKHLRADEQISNVICPINKGSVPLIKKMLDQVLEMHPTSTQIHLGGDEVYNLKTCEKCKVSNMSDFGLYTHHMVPIFQHIKLKSTPSGAKIQPIIWDDMLRKWDTSKLKVIAQYATPMVWGYVADISKYRNFPIDMWERFAAAFPNIWIASSFKGALKPWSNFVPIEQHLQNHITWLDLIWKLRQKGSNILGVAITGWSRFDHYGPLCELLPAGIPSLALCLSVLKTGKFNDDLHIAVSKKLGFKDPFKIRIPSFKDYTPEKGGYHGGEFYELVGTLEKATGLCDWSDVRITGWTRDYVTKSRSLSYFHMNSTLSALRRSKELTTGLELKVSNALLKLFHRSVVDEWIADKIQTHNARVEASIKKLTPFLQMAATSSTVHRLNKI